MRTATQTLILKYLQEDDLNVHELAALLNMNAACLNYPLKKLLENRLIKHVAWKQQHPGRPLRIYSSKMTKKPAPTYQKLTGAEKQKRHQEKYKALIRLRRLTK